SPQFAFCCGWAPLGWRRYCWSFGRAPDMDAPSRKPALPAWLRFPLAVDFYMSVVVILRNHNPASPGRFLSTRGLDVRFMVLQDDWTDHCRFSSTKLSTPR